MTEWVTHPRMLTISLEDPASAEANLLIAELSATLAHITGDSGRSSFDPEDVRGPKACFVVARDRAGQAVGCGALRPLKADIAEVKRMYARPGAASARDPDASRNGSGQLWLSGDLAGDAAREHPSHRVLRTPLLSPHPELRQVCRQAGGRLLRKAAVATNSTVVPGQTTPRASAGVAPTRGP
jgi:hypothetical protein